MSTSTDSSSSPLPALGLLKHLTDAERAELSAYGTFIDHQKGEKLVEQGRPQGHLHFVLEGELRVVAASEEALLTLGYVEPGESVGEMTLLEPVEAASANVVAQSPVKVWAIQRRDFDDFIHHHPAASGKILREIAVLLAQRLRRRTEHLMQAER